MNANPRDDLPLAGIRVLDLSRVLAGPWCTQTLADLGAEVWKIEAPGQGDDTRSWSPPDIDGESTYFLCANRSKESVAINLKHPEGQRIVRDLARQADVLVENYRLGALEAFGLGYEDLAAINPGLIYCSITGYGRSGPRAAEPGYDFVIQAESGLMSITGEPDGAPMKLGVAITDLITGMNGVQAILAALAGSPELRDVRHRYQQDFVDQCAQWLGPFVVNGKVPVAGRWAILGAAEALSEAVAGAALPQADAESELQRLIVDIVTRAS